MQEYLFRSRGREWRGKGAGEEHTRKESILHSYFIFYIPNEFCFLKTSQILFSSSVCFFDLFFTSGYIYYNLPIYSFSYPTFSHLPPFSPCPAALAHTAVIPISFRCYTKQRNAHNYTDHYHTHNEHYKYALNMVG